MQKVNWQYLIGVFLLSRSARSFFPPYMEGQLCCSESEKCLLLSASDGEGMNSLNPSLIDHYPNVHL